MSHQTINGFPIPDDFQFPPNFDPGFPGFFAPSLCEGSVCAQFSSGEIPQGTLVTLIGNSGNFYGPATFTNFDLIGCIVTLEEQGTFTPPTTNVIEIGCENIEAVIIHQG